MAIPLCGQGAVPNETGEFWPHEWIGARPRQELASFVPQVRGQGVTVARSTVDARRPCIVDAQPTS